MRKQYHFWPAEQGFDAWDVDRLIELSADLPVHGAAVDAIAEIDTTYWSCAPLLGLGSVLIAAKPTIDVVRSVPLRRRPVQADRTTGGA